MRVRVSVCEVSAGGRVYVWSRRRRRRCARGGGTCVDAPLFVAAIMYLLRFLVINEMIYLILSSMSIEHQVHTISILRYYTVMHLCLYIILSATNEAYLACNLRYLQRTNLSRRFN